MVGGGDLCHEIDDLLADVQRALQVGSECMCETWWELGLTRRPYPRIRQFGACGLKRTATRMIAGINGMCVEDEFAYTREEAEASERYFLPHNGEPFVSTDGREPLIKSPGWHTHHYIEFSANHELAEVAIEALNSWSARRANELLPLTFPGLVVADFRESPDTVCRRTEVNFPWVNFLISIAGQGLRTIEPPEWMVTLEDGRSCDVELWTRRDEFRLRFSSADEERIGDRPEAAFTKRQRVLRDSEKSLRWLQRRFTTTSELADVDRFVPQRTKDLAKEIYSLRQVSIKPNQSSEDKALMKRVKGRQRDCERDGRDDYEKAEAYLDWQLSRQPDFSARPPSF